MAAADRREELYQEARRELLLRMERERLSELDEHARRNEVTRCVRDLGARWPGLDGQLSRRLLAETLADADVAYDSRRGHDAAPSGHANVTTLRRDFRESIR